MFDHHHYVPVLKGKLGEYNALSSLAEDVKAALTPMIEIPPIQWDFENEVPLKSIDAHLEKVVGQLKTSWGTARPIFLDLRLLQPDEKMIGGVHPILALAGEAKEEGVLFVPVTGLRRNSGATQAVAAAAKLQGNGACIRLEGEDFRDIRVLETELSALVDALGTPPEETDLVLDLGAIGEAATTTALAVTSMISDLPLVARWRTLTVASSSFPENLSGVSAASSLLAPRADWLAWRGVIDRATSLKRIPTFGDYAIAHPDLSDVDPRIMRMSANLRYTTDENWLLLKGRDVRRHGFDQFYALCKDLVARPEYCGASFSWGDKQISKCATGPLNPGNATTWRKIGTSHHLTFVVRQIATSIVP
jgi:hypothetical protein